MENLKDIGLGAFKWDFIGRIIGQSVSFIITIFLARLLNPSDFGLLAMINVIIVIANSFLDMGLGVSLIQKKNVRDEHYGAVFYFNVFIGFLLALLLFFASGFIADFYKQQSLHALIQCMSLLFIFSSFGNVIRSKLRKELNYTVLTKSSLFGSIFSGIIGIILAYFGFGVWSLVFQSLLNSLLSNIWLYCEVDWRPKLIWSWDALKELWSFGFRMFLSSFLEVIYVNVDSLIIGKFFPIEKLGYYNRAKTLYTYSNSQISATLMNVLFPMLSEVQNNDIKFKEIVYKGFHLINFITFLLIGLFFINAKEIIIILFSVKWLPSLMYFKLLLLTGFLYPLSSVLVNVLTSRGNSKVYFRLELIKKIILVFGLLPLIFLGINEFLISSIFISFVILFINLKYAAKELNEKKWVFISIILPYLIVFCLLMVAMYYIRSHFQLVMIFSIFFSSIFFAGMYVSICILFNFKGVVLIKDLVKNEYQKMGKGK